MSKTQYSKKFGFTGLSFQKTNLSKEEIENVTDLRLTKDAKKTKDSWKIFINLKKVKNPFNRTNLFSRNNFIKNQSYIPLTKNQLSIIHYNKAPSLKDNQKDIIKFIKKKKLMQKKEIDNMYNSILINESKLFRTNLYITQNENKNKNIESNLNLNIKKSKKIFQIIPSKNNKEITGSTSIENIKNSNSVTNINNNETKISFPILGKDKTHSTKFYHNLFFRTSNKDMKNELMRSKSTSNYSRIRMEINDTLFNNLKCKEDYPELGKKMMKFNVICNIQSNKLNKILSKEEYNYDKRYAKLINLKNLIEKTYISFFEKMHDYLKFLSNIIMEYKTELNVYDREIKEIDDDLEVIIVDIVKYQADLEYLVARRNFLLLIKQRFGNPPSYYEELLVRDSKILLVGDAICDLKVTKLIKNKSVMIFNNSYLEVKEKIKDNILNMDNILNNPIIDKQLFGSVDEFILLYKSLENKNLKYLKDKDNAEKQIDKLKQQYNDEIKMNHDYFLDNEIKNKENELEKIINKNEILVRTYNYYHEILLKSMDNKNKITYKINKINNKISKEKKISSIDMNTMKKYYEQLGKYKYDGLLLLHKLIELLKNLSHIKYDKSHNFSEILNDKNIKMILNLNLHKFNSEKIYLINSYIILLISKFEIICKYVINKNDIYSIDKKNKEFINQKQMQLFLEKKKLNSEELREILKNKKLEEMKKIVEKSSKISAYIPYKVCPENSVKRNKALKNIQKQILTNNKNNYLEYEFNNYVNYADEI